MSFIANTDALIIDLRDNLGGSSDMNQFLLSYFFKGENLPLTKEYFRIYDAYQEVSTLDKVPGKFYDNDIYVLVNSNTYLLAGSSILMSALTSVTAGTASPSKALVLDGSSGITGVATFGLSSTSGGDILTLTTTATNARNTIKSPIQGEEANNFR